MDKTTLELVRKIKNESEDIMVLAEVIEQRLKCITLEDISEDTNFEFISMYLQEMFDIKENLSKDITSLKRKTKGN